MRSKLLYAYSPCVIATHVCSVAGEQTCGRHMSRRTGHVVDAAVQDGREQVVRRALEGGQHWKKTWKP